MPAVAQSLTLSSVLHTNTDARDCYATPDVTLRPRRGFYGSLVSRVAVTKPPETFDIFEIGFFGKPQRAQSDTEVAKDENNNSL